jgi:uncharacterized protein (TIRG00374 family)
MGSEFVALSTPSMIGGEFVRAAWLSARGVDGGKALWIGYFEVMIDVYVGSAFALISAQYAFAKGAVVIGSTIVVIVLLLVIGYTVVFLIPAMRGIPILPKGLFKFAALFIGNERARRLELVVQKGTETFSLAASQILRRNALALILKTLGLTVIQVFLSGIALWFVLTAAGLKIDIISSTLVAGGTSAIAAIPISIGGSGVTELTMQSYLVLVFGFSSWAAVVLWRIASFQVVLAASGIAFLLLTHRSTKPVSSSEHLSPTDPPLEILVPGEITIRRNPASRAVKSPAIPSSSPAFANHPRRSASRGTHDLLRLVKEAPRHTC